MSDEPLRIGLLLPCRNEASVLDRKLANLNRLRWPAGAHRIVIVDDGSTDRTFAIAHRARLAQPHLVTSNDVHPGKAGAIQAGLRALGEEVDVVVLTDADVVLDEGALEAVSRAFAAEPELAMACGKQRFVTDLDEYGRLRGLGGDELVPAGGPYDRISAWIRRLESSRGLLFSVHGQLLAWRADLGLVPRTGLAADDLDLRVQVARLAPELPRRVRLLEEAVFHEVAPPGGSIADAQRLRRAQAFAQFLAAEQELGPRTGIPALQWFAYAWGPRLAPWPGSCSSRCSSCCRRSSCRRPGAGSRSRSS